VRTALNETNWFREKVFASLVPKNLRETTRLRAGLCLSHALSTLFTSTTKVSAILLFEAMKKGVNHATPNPPERGVHDVGTPVIYSSTEIHSNAVSKQDCDDCFVERQTCACSGVS
jgi:hypothetical protein